jgi:hypothetical protein
MSKDSIRRAKIDRLSYWYLANNLYMRTYFFTQRQRIVRVQLQVRLASSRPSASIDERRSSRNADICCPTPIWSSKVGRSEGVEGRSRR